MNTTTGTIKTATLAIDGMSCGHCVQAVTKILSAVRGAVVKWVTVGSAVIETADGWTTGRAVAALAEAGYPAKTAGDFVGPVASSPAKSGGCCGGAKNAMPGGGSSIPKAGGSAQASGGRCG